MKRSTQRVTKFMLFFVVLSGVGGGVYYRWHKRRLRRMQPTYTEVKVSRGDVRITVQATGAAQPENRLIIKPPISGRIDSINVNEGDKVKKGQVLALMSSTDRAALLDVARSKGPAEVRHWEDIYRPTPIVAPMDGVIIARSIEPGQTLSNVDTVLVMSDHLIVMAQVDETDMAKVSLGQPAEITLDAYANEKIQGHVHQIAFEALTVNNVTIYDVEVTPDKVPEFMRSGMTASVSFQVAERRGVLTVPVAALKHEGSRTTVLKRPESAQDGAAASASTDADGAGRSPHGRHAQRGGDDAEAAEAPNAVEIQTGLTDGRVAEVVSGLNEGETILQEVVRLPEAKQSGTNPFGPPGRPGGGGKRP